MKKFTAVSLSMIIIAGAAIFYITSIWTQVPYEAEKNHLIIGGDIITDVEEPLLEDGNILLSFNAIKKYLDPNAYWDEKLGKVVFTTKDKLITMKTDKLSAMVNQKPVDLNIPARDVDKIPYIPIEFLQEMLDITATLASGRIAVIDYNKEPIITGKLLEQRGVKRDSSIFSPFVVKNLDAGEKVRVFDRTGKWCKVRTKDGVMGYIEDKYLEIGEEARPEPLPEEPVIEPFRPEKGKINMVWEHVVNKNPDISKLKKMEGLDIVSPTWFAVTDAEGNIANKGDMEYVEWAHLNGYQVWGLATNGFNPDNTHIFLNNTDTREKIINQLLIYANLYKLDGINIDFENIYVKDKDMFTQFMRELYPLCREQGLTLSVDVTMISGSANWSQSFNRKALSEAVDYMAVMAYDQHWASSPKAGSVAQYKWVEYGLKRILEEVPAEKLILGMPFYTRLWQEQKVDGSIKVSSKALSMSGIQKILKEKTPEVKWDAESGQYYAQYKENDMTYKVWIEDARSINLKSSLVHKYGLAGAAAWRRGFETENIWAVIADNLKDKEDYQQWAQANNFDLLSLE
ncbi:glycosyl hydrolase family 18 protein [Lutispora sp.]|uniref:glycosyl hydrolase family 18 protein n=1 Tax=Lutispora sp. TaxID=2828727 RepID=UPI002B21E84B|nr:glycosyl hydrolase family 18 protein [Lutispora sp.]MEA4961418.1 glycosyl hydrolase family 18 protein [Lutispora sp.]